MIKNLMRRGLSALTLCSLSLFASVPVAYSAPRPGPVSIGAGDSASGPAGQLRAPLPLFVAIDRLPVAVEHREGYTRDLYKHWNKGLNSGDGCDTRKVM